jgi:hypothetical protein
LRCVHLIFEYIMDISLTAPVNFLKKDCKLDLGFCSQKVGSQTRSAATTAIVVYALGKLDLLSKEERDLYCNELLQFQILSGENAGAFGANSKDYVWSTSQACLALETVGRNDEELNNAIQWLCKVQTCEGGWNFNGNQKLAPSIEYCLYPLLALRNFGDDNPLVSNSLRLGWSYVNKYKTTTTFSKIVRLFLLKKVYGIATFISEERDALRSFRHDILSDFDGNKIFDSDESHFYVDFYLPSYYLLTRAFVKPDNALSLYLIKLLKDTVIDSKGWAPPHRQEPYSWTTALSLITIFFWMSDCKKQKIDFDTAKKKILSIRKGDINVQTYVERCPLNGGLCNKIEEINKGFSDKKIFLDIPYNEEYLTFEDALKETIAKNGLTPVMAKDSIKSKAILCKMCQLIQESKFGLADVSYPTHNIPFELGLLLGLGKNCVILKKKDAPIPTDISGLEYVEYQNTRQLKEKLALWITDNK